MKKRIIVLLLSLLLLFSPFLSLKDAKSSLIMEQKNIFESHKIPMQQQNVASSFSEWEMMMLNASDGESNDNFGCSVSVCRNYAVIGAAFDDNATGSAYIFEHTGATWIQVAKLKAEDGEPDDVFGWSVSLDETMCVIGAPGDDNQGNDSGAVYVFTGISTTWTQQQKLVASDAVAGDFFGYSISKYQDYIAISTWADDNSTGSVYVFKWDFDEQTWKQQTKLFPSDGMPNLHFGNSVSINEDHLVVGLYMDWDLNSTSTAYVFERSGTTWIEETIIRLSETEPTGIAIAVSIYGDYLMIGAPYDGIFPVTGAAYIYRHEGSTWIQLMKLTGGSSPFESFGESVSIGDRYAATIRTKAFDEENGSVYICKREGTTWSLDTELTGLTLDVWPFGNTISVSGSCVLVGNSGFGQGNRSAYVFWKPAPLFEILLKGSTFSIKNIGDANATNVSVNRNLDGGLILLGKDKTVMLPRLAIGETKEARLGMIFGFGRTILSISISCDQGVTQWAKIHAIVLFVLIIIR